MSQPKHVQVMEFISDAERRFPVDKWSSQGIFIWPIIRILLSFQLFAFLENVGANQISLNQSLAYRLPRIAKSIIRAIMIHFTDWRRNGSIRPVDVVFFICSSGRFFKVGGEWYQPYADSFIPQLEERGLQHLVLESAGDGEYRVPRYRESIFVQNKLFLLTLSSLFWSQLSRPKDENLPGFEEFLSELRTRLGYTKMNIGVVRRRVTQVAFYRAYFKKVLKRAQPLVTVNDGYYSLETMAFLHACRDLDIRSIEIQHGVQGEFHAAYRKWLKMPPAGYPLLPNVFWCWGNQEYANIHSWTRARSHWHWPVVGSNPCLQIYAKDGKDLTESLSEGVMSKGIEKRVNILFTLQAFYQLPKFLTDTMKQSPETWIWWMRVHPQYWETRESVRQLLKAMGLRNFVIDEASDLPLATLLRHMDVHVTEYSSSVLEAEASGVFSVVIHEKGAVLYHSSIAQGTVRVALDRAELIEAIAIQVQKKLDMGMTMPHSHAQFHNAIDNVIVALCRPSASAAGSSPARQL